MNYIKQSQAQEFEQQCSRFFKEKKLQLLHKPISSKQRQCTDIFYLIIFLIIILSFIGYSIISTNKMLQLNAIISGNKSDITFLSNVSTEQFKKTIIVIGYSIAISIGLALIILILFKFIPTYTVIAMALTTCLIPLSIAILDFVTVTSDISYYFLLITICSGYYIISQKDALTKSAILIKTVGNFIAQNKKIIIVLLFSLLYSLISLFFWITGFYSFCVLQSKGELSYGGFVVSLLYWIFMLYFLNTYFYFTNLFLNSTALAIWFYNKHVDDQTLDIVITPFKLMVRYHLGTITYMSLISPFNTILKILFWIARLPLLGKIFSFCLSTCAGKQEAMTQVIGEYSIILCGMTGYDLLNSSKIVGELIFNAHDQSFTIFNMINFLVSLGGNMIVWLLPTLIGGVVLLQLPGALWALSVVIIMFTSSITGSLILSVFIQTMTTLFLLYNVDGRLTQYGVPVEWIDHISKQMQKGFDEAFVGQIKKYKIKTKNITTIVIHQNGAHEVFQQKINVMEQGTKMQLNDDLTKNEIINKPNTQM